MTPWIWPLVVVGSITGFAAPEGPYGAGHRGIDLPAPAGASVLAVADGTVAWAGQVAGKPVVVLRISERLRVTYEPVSTPLGPGDRVRAGEPVGELAETGGHCGGRCLHLGLREETRYRDPRPFLVTGHPVLKPVGGPAAWTLPRVSATPRFPSASIADAPG